MSTHSVLADSYMRLPIEEDKTGVIHALHNAYRTGRSKPRSSSAEQWREQLQNSLTTSTWEKDRPVLVRCGHYLNKARASAAAGETEAACLFFLKARLSAESKDLSAEGRLRAKTELAANEAYLEYCFGHFERAKQSLLVSMEAGQQMEQRFNSPFFHLHRIHLVNNMVKVEAAAQNLHGAMELAASVLLYLQQKAENLPVPGNWGSCYFREIPSDAIRFLTAQTTGEIAVALAGLPPSVVKKALQILLSRVKIDELCDSWQPEISAWLRLKLLMADDEAQYAAYFARCIPYFSQGPGCTAGLWYLTALDVAAVCQPFHDSESSRLKQDIIADLRRMTHLPRRVRAIVNHLAANLEQPGSPAQVEIA